MAELGSHIGRRVKFRAPADVLEATGREYEYGTIEDEIYAEPEKNRTPPRTRRDASDWGDYSFFSQKIRWDDGNYAIRLGYFRRKPDSASWRFGAQTTFTCDPSVARDLLNQTLQRSEWFSPKCQPAEGETN